MKLRREKRRRQAYNAQFVTMRVNGPGSFSDILIIPRSELAKFMDEAKVDYSKQGLERVMGVSPQRFDTFILGGKP